MLAHIVWVWSFHSSCLCSHSSDPARQVAACPSEHVGFRTLLLIKHSLRLTPGWCSISSPWYGYNLHKCVNFLVVMSCQMKSIVVGIGVGSNTILGELNVIYTVIAVICAACMNVSRVKYWGGGAGPPAPSGSYVYGLCHPLELTIPQLTGLIFSHMTAMSACQWIAMWRWLSQLFLPLHCSMCSCQSMRKGMFTVANYLVSMHSGMLKQWLRHS